MKKIKLNVSAFAELCTYIKHCFEQEFFIESQTLGNLIEFHLQEIWEKLHRKSLDVQYKGQNTVRLTFTAGELLTFSFLFNEVPVSGYMLTIQHKIIAGL